VFSEGGQLFMKFVFSRGNLGT